MSDTTSFFAAELLSVSQMRAADRVAMEQFGIPGVRLMDHAGQAVAERVMARVSVCRVLVLCGRGNNGGDGFVAARYLRARGYLVTVALMSGVTALKGESQHACEQWDESPVLFSPSLLDDADLVVDAIFGAGLDRNVEGEAAIMVAALNQSGLPVVAVDVPSGLDANTGQVLGIAVRAIETVTFFRAKLGHFLYPGRELCGKVTLADIGIPEEVLGLGGVASSVVRNDPHIWVRDWPTVSWSSNKYSRGAVLIRGGAMSGAGRLAMLGAAYSGAGLVRAAVPDALRLAYELTLAAAVVLPCNDAQDFAGFLQDERVQALAIGSGGGGDYPSIRAEVLAVLGSGRPCVLDADALNAFAGEVSPTLFEALHSACVLTPHEGEFARLFPRLAGEENSRFEQARKAAQLSGAVVVLKGADTVIAAPAGGQCCAINDNGMPWLATAGTGDVLAGYIAGLMAQGMPAFSAACAAVWVHGAASERLGAGLVADDLPQGMAAVAAPFHRAAAGV